MGQAFLQGRVALITGASSGIGRATAMALAAAGARVVLAARNAQALAETAGVIQGMGGEALAITADVTQDDQVDELIRSALAAWGRIDILVANAGNYVRSPVKELTVEMLERSMAVNFYGSVRPVLALLPKMLAQGSGHIILVTSLDGKKGIPPDAPYVAAKFALTGLGDVLRQELHRSGVRVTTILPGRVDTPMIADLKVPGISAKIPPAVVARAIVRAIRRPRPEVVVPAMNKALVYLQAISPRFCDWGVRFFRLSGTEEKKNA